jgi:hypothetical protein
MIVGLRLYDEMSISAGGSGLLCSTDNRVKVPNPQLIPCLLKSFTHLTERLGFWEQSGM